MSVGFNRFYQKLSLKRKSVGYVADMIYQNMIIENTFQEIRIPGNLKHCSSATRVWSDTSKVEAQGVLGVPSGVRLGREDLVGGRPDRYSLQTGLDTVCKGRYRAVASGAAWSRLPRLALVCCTPGSRSSLLHSPSSSPFRQEESRPPPSRHRRIDFC